MHNIREIHVVFNTHWDREFRETFEITRRHLVEMMDTTLDLMEADPRVSSFTLDAHVILVEDYLEARPERREQVQRMLRDRRLLIGPWYTLPDSMNVGGEALVRNFLRARQVAESLGARCMTAGYSPNNWGQPSQMPQIFRGFGVDSALIYRGISPHECPSEWIWQGPDGSEIHGHRFARLARYNWYYLVFRPVTRGVEPTDKRYPLAGSAEVPFRVADGRSRATPNFQLLRPAESADFEKLMPALEAMLELEGPDSATGLFLAMHGHDVSVLHPKDADIVERAAAAFKGRYDIRVSNLEDFMARVRESLDPAKAVRLTGERRMNLKEGFWTYLLPSTISARTCLKVLNTRAENALVGEAEPLSVLSRVLGREYPTVALDRAWRFLLGNHTHDANAGCAPDSVCQDMEYRYRQCLDLADTCTTDAMTHVAANLGGGKPGDIRVLVFNPLALPRNEVLEVEVAWPATDAPAAVQIVDGHGQPCPAQVVDVADDSLFVDSKWDVPTYADVRRFRLKAAFPDLPALGYRAYTVRPAKQTPVAPSHLAQPDGRSLENEYLRVDIRPDGSVDALHKPTGRWYRGLNAYHDQGEAGNAWSHEPPQEDEVFTTAGGRTHVTRIENGPVSAAVRVRNELALPADCPDGLKRSETRVPFVVDTDYELRRGDPRLFIRTAFDNCVRDHWLRAIFPTHLKTDVVRADTHFDLVERPIAHPDDRGWIEPFRGTAPMHSVVDLSDGQAGLAVLTEGLFEYEVFDDDRRAIALSLVRSFPIRLQVSEEKRQVLPDTGVQCPGPQEFRYAILPHAGDAIAADVLNWAQRCTSSPRVAQVAVTGGALPEEHSLIRLEGEGLVVTATKKAERSGDILIRLFNADIRPRHGVLHFGFPVTAVRTASLAEEPGPEWKPEGRCLSLTVPPKKIATLLVTAELKDTP